MNVIPRTPKNWRDLIQQAGLDKDTTRVALALADRFDGLAPKEGPAEKDHAAMDVRQAMVVLEDLDFLRIREPEDPQATGLQYTLVLPPAERPSESIFPAPPRTVNPTLNSLDEVVLPQTRSQPKRPKPPAKRKGVRRRETVLYRYYDAEDVLLYVGVSANMPGRLEGHETDSTWMDFAHRSTLEHFTDRDAAEAAEIAAIEADRPIFNILHNETPDRVRRIVDYLIDRDRRDLLVPLISRG